MSFMYGLSSNAMGTLKFNHQYTDDTSGQYDTATGIFTANAERLYYFRADIYERNQIYTVKEAY